MVDKLNKWTFETAIDKFRKNITAKSAREIYWKQEADAKRFNGAKNAIKQAENEFLSQWTASTSMTYEFVIRVEQRYANLIREYFKLGGIDFEENDVITEYKGKHINLKNVHT